MSKGYQLNSYSQIKSVLKKSKTVTVIRRKAEKICRTKLFGKTCGDEVKERVAILKIFLRSYNQPKSCSNVEIINFHSANKTFFCCCTNIGFWYY